MPDQTPATIDETLSAFLAEQRERLSARTFRNYADVIQLLGHSLDGYAHSSLDADELRRFEQAFDGGDEHAFCRLFGPE
ncbi:MAG: hypothetical protein LC790_11085, partial [Actinobacteria bacterium]|nr:hypothetical protein [Actinomycetota bacterium]